MGSVIHRFTHLSPLLSTFLHYNGSISHKEFMVKAEYLAYFIKKERMLMRRNQFN